ncbi:MAG: nucleotidyltransferase domain-containing protein [Planctomycetota bacterium]
MNSLLEMNREAIARLCAQYHVIRLEVFGSATGADFDADHSDVDFLVRFSPCSPSEHYERYFGMLESLRSLFQREIDLVEADALKNPYLMRRIDESRDLIYAA